MLFGEAKLPVGQGQAQVDFGLFLEEFQCDRQKVALAKGNRSRHVQPAAQSAMIAAGLFLRGIQRLENAP
ncbi:hypothetical protein D3C80_1166350 [compost metagenome]